MHRVLGPGLGAELVAATLLAPGNVAVAADSPDISVTNTKAHLDQLQSIATSNGGNLLQNPGFESGTANWTGTSGVITNSSSRPARTGTYKAWLQGNGTRAACRVCLVGWRLR
jgi:hypothetical protein